MSYLRLILIPLALLGAALLLGLLGRPAAAYPASAGPGAPVPPCGPGAWSTQTPYPIHALDQGAVSYGGLLYSFGGYTGSSVTANAYKYDPAANTWTPIASLPTPLSGVRAVTDGTYIYLVGGLDNSLTEVNTFWRYDPVTDSYNTALAQLPSAAGSHAAAYLAGQIYRVAGLVAPGTATTAVQAYTISTNTWRAVANYPLAVLTLAGVAMDDYLYTAGGTDTSSVETNKTYRYDPGTDAWDDAAIADLPSTRYAAASGLLNGQWIIAGGYHNGAVTGVTVAWDPAANSWTAGPDMPLARGFLGGTAVGPALYALGGFDSAQQVTADNQQYLMTCSTPSPTATPSATPSATATVSATSTPLPSATPTVTPCAPMFSDVHTSDYFYAHVQYLACHGAISGYGDGTFRPYAATTRGQLTKIVTTAFAVPPYSPPNGAYTFADVLPGSAFAPYVEGAAHAGIVGGYACGGPGEACDAQHRPYFRPYASVTRAQLSKIVVLTAGWPINTSGGPHFSDVPAADPFYGVVETAYNHGIISGYGDGTFRSGAPATRGQISKIVYLALTQP